MYLSWIFLLLCTCLKTVISRDCGTAFLVLDSNLKPIEGNRLTVHGGDNVNIKCFAGPASSGDDHTYLSWKKSSNGKVVSFASAQQTILPDRHAKPMICDVHLLSFFGIALNDQGNYTCLRNGTAVKSIYINVIKPAVPLVTVSPNGIANIVESKEVSLVCNATGSPIPNIHWMQGNETLKSCLKKNFCELKLNTKKSGTFFCVAENNMGHQNSSVIINVLVPPEINRQQTIVHGNTLSCSVQRAVPTPHFMWQYQECSNSYCNSIDDDDWKSVDGQAMQVIPHLNVKTTNSTVIVSTEKLHALFRCIAINVAGNDSDVIQVSLIGVTSKNTSIIVVSVIATCLILVLVILMVIMIRRRNRHKYAKFFSSYQNDYQIQSDVDIMEQGLHLPYDTAWEYPRNRLEFVKVLGSGAFGQVWLARAVDIQNWTQHPDSQNNINGKSNLHYLLRKSNKNNNKVNYNVFVAVKTLKDESSESQCKDLATEIKVLIYVGKHQNIVNLLGACTRGGSPFAILEFCPFGDLKHFLKGRREHFSASWDVAYTDPTTGEFTLGHAMSMAYQIAKGMTFLHSKKLVHRDLACRNILLGEHYCIKISDFGLTRDVYKEDYVKTTTGLLPVKWMSPESLFDKIYNVKTDVWSFAIVLWEVFTLGGSPYPGISVENLFPYIQSGKRMSKPSVCPSEVYDLMSQCWSQIPTDRPTFDEIMPVVSEILSCNVQNNPYLQLIKEDEPTTPLCDPTTPLNGNKRSKQKFFISGLFGSHHSKKRRAVSSNAEDQLLSRLSSTNSDVFMK